MRYTTIISILVLAIAGCKDKEAAGQVFHLGPHAVYNKCMNRWAVLIDSTGPTCMGDHHQVTFFGRNFRCSINTSYIIGRRDNEEDSTSSASLGDEIQFADSATAMRTFYAHRDRLQREAEEQQRLERAYQATADSLFKCQHGYQ